VSPAKTAEPIEMPFGLWPRVGPGNHVLDGGPDSHMERDNFEGKGRPIVKYRDALRSPVSFVYIFQQRFLHNVSKYSFSMESIS